MVIIATKDLCPNAWEPWTVSCAIWHSLKCCQSLWIHFRLGHCSLPIHEDNILHVLGDKKSRLSVKWFNVSCLYFFSDRFSPNTMCLTLYISNRGQKMSGLIHTSLHILSVLAVWQQEDVFFQCSLFYSIIRRHLKFTSCPYHDLLTFILFNWRFVDSTMNKQTQTHKVRLKDIAF